MRRYVRTSLYRVVEVCFYSSILVGFDSSAIRWLQAANLISIIVVAQAFDNLFLKIFGGTATLQVYPEAELKFHKSAAAYNLINSSALTLKMSLGYITTALVCIPLSQQTMEENMKVQYISFIFLILTVTGLCINAGNRIMTTAVGLSDQASRVPRAFGRGFYGELMSTFLASYSYVNVIPSWANEMAWNVNVGVISSYIVYLLGCRRRSGSFCVRICSLLYIRIHACLCLSRSAYR